MTERKPFIVVVAGGRDFGDRRIPGQGLDVFWRDKCRRQMKVAIDAHLARIFKNEDLYPVIRHGDAKGADTLAGEYAMYDLGIDVDAVPANWDKYGKSAGRVRNADMATGAGMLIAFWDGRSRGTKHMIDIAMAQGIETHVYRYMPA
jgi:hypothetical protein